MSTLNIGDRPRVQSIEPSVLFNLLNEANSGAKVAPRIIDLRSHRLWRTGTLPNAVHIPSTAGIHALNKVIGSGQPLCLVCQRGESATRLSHELCRELAACQQSDLWVLEGGMQAWHDAGLPVASSTRDFRWSWEDVRDQFAIASREVPVLDGSRLPLLYLDHAASTHPPARVIDAFYEFLTQDYANIHRGTYRLSRDATARFDHCYDVVARFIGGNLVDDAVVFTHNTTHSLDLAAYLMGPVPGNTIVSDLEHHSNDLPHRRRGDVVRCPLTPEGRLDMAALERLLARRETKLVAITAASNVTGWMPNLDRIAQLAHHYGAKILVDAAQRLAHHRLNVHAADDPRHLDFVAGAGHKSYAPFGAAFLYCPRAILDERDPYLPGGGTAATVTRDSVEFVRGHERHQGGTPNIAGVVAMAEALAFLDEIGLDRVRSHELQLMEKTFDALAKRPSVKIYGPSPIEERVAVFAFNVGNMPDLLAAAVLSEERAIACRNGRFCAHPHVDFLLRDDASNDTTPKGAIRGSYGLFNDDHDVDRLIEGVDLLIRGDFRGSYRLGTPHSPSEAIGRCNDRWMEAQDSGT